MAVEKLVPHGSVAAPASLRRLTASATPTVYDCAPQSWDRPVLGLAAEVITAVLLTESILDTRSISNLLDAAVAQHVRAAYGDGMVRRGVLQARSHAMQYLGQFNPIGDGWEFAGDRIAARIAALEATPELAELLTRGHHMGPRLAWTRPGRDGEELLLDRLHHGYYPGHLDGSWAARKVRADLELADLVTAGAVAGVRLITPRMVRRSRHCLPDGSWHEVAGCSICREEGPWARS